MGKTQEELVQMYLDMQFCNVNLVADNQRKDERIANLEEIVRLRNAQKFAPSSEQTGYLFDELELLANLEDQKDGLPLEEQTVTVSEHERKQSRPRVNTTLPADTPVIDVNAYDEAPETKVVDGVVYRRTSDKVIDKIYLVPQKYIVVREHFLRYEPSETADPDDKPIVVFREPKLDGMAATPNFIAKAVVAKYDDYQPLYRQEEMHGRAGLKVSRQKLAGWIIQYYEALLPLERVLKKHVYSSAMLYKDETRTTVLSVKSSGGRISRNGYMYITLGTTFVEKGSNFHTLVLCDVRDHRFQPENDHRFQPVQMSSNSTNIQNAVDSIFVSLSYLRQYGSVAEVHLSDYLVLSSVRLACKVEAIGSVEKTVQYALRKN